MRLSYRLWHNKPTQLRERREDGDRQEKGRKAGHIVSIYSGYSSILGYLFLLDAKVIVGAGARTKASRILHYADWVDRYKQSPRL